MPDSPIGPGSGRNTAPRAYKACLSCRKRKTRCDLGGRDHPPCQRCRHELRDCILPQERSSRRQPSARVQAHAGNSASHPSNNERGGRDLPSPSTVPSPRIPPQQHAGPEASVCSTLAHQRETSADLEDSIIHTTVANGNDALGLLLHQNRPAHGIAGDGPDGNASAEERNPVGTQEPFAFAGGPCDQQQAFAWATDDMKKAWSASKLGQMGWLRAHEAVSLLDSFFRNMAPFTPIISNHHHSLLRNHVNMISSEPFLCAVILMISSRYNSIPGRTGPSHTFQVHSCLWRYCQKLIMAVIFGQGRFALGDYPSYGIILALLLLCEWHPRALHFAPDTDGFGGLALPALGRNTEDEGCSSQERWIGEVQETVKCSDRMSTMLVGCALTLSHELRVFEDVDDRLNETIYSSTQSQRAHIRHLIYLYTHLLADKPSFITILPEKVSYFLAENRHIENSAENEQPITQAWLELSELWNSFRERAVVTKTSGPEGQRARKCFSVVDHFTSLLAQWAQRHNWSSDRTAGLQQIIAIEYHYVQIHCNSFGMQVQVDQKSRHGHRVTTEAEHENIHMRSHTAAAVRYAQNVTSHCCSLLETIMEINNGQIFRYAPVRVFMRTIAASVLLLKSLAIGMRTGQLQSILALLDRVVQALGENSIDDVHLARHYAKLLNTYIRKARRRFAIGSTTHSGQGENAIEPSMNGSGSQREAVPTSNVTEQPATAHPSVDLGFDFDADYWYSLPLGSENDIFSYVLPGASDF